MQKLVLKERFKCIVGLIISCLVNIRMPVNFVSLLMSQYSETTFDKMWQVAEAWSYFCCICLKNRFS